jgi:hypothetical protein
MTTPSSDCLSCIDGMAPTTSDLFGACYRTCPVCQPACACCHGESCFPCWTTDLGEFLDSFNTIGLLPILCHTCYGAVGIAQMSEMEDPHDHTQP